MALSWVWVLLGLAMKDAQSVQGLGAVLIFPLSFASNMFVPPATMPGWLRAFVEVNPVTHFMDAMRGLMLGGPVARPGHLDAAVDGRVRRGVRAARASRVPPAHLTPAARRTRAHRRRRA